ncbi:hypothetical protein A4D02_24800 [Niastella koreensis]|uniref:Uncharacterized protein n=1 Tax=Niastella koreensis TaxID=354356 RepID=A0ABX3P253_9BACT|nr:hypothetical protein A4D02_24800 [Niastella koreensis]
MHLEAIPIDDLYVTRVAEPLVASMSQVCQNTGKHNSVVYVQKFVVHILSFINGVYLLDVRLCYEVG